MLTQAGLARMALTLVVAAAVGTMARAYHVDTHWYLTFAIARDAGFTPLQAERIAIANQLCDEHPLLEPVQLGLHRKAAQIPRARYHAMFDSEGVLSDVRSREEQFTALVASCKRLDNPGPALHFLQDYFSHYGYSCLWGHWDFPEAVLGFPGNSPGLPHGGLTDVLGYEPAKWLTGVGLAYPKLQRDERMLAGSFDFLRSWSGGSVLQPLSGFEQNLPTSVNMPRSSELLKRLKTNFNDAPDPKLFEYKLDGIHKAFEPNEAIAKSAFSQVLKATDNGTSVPERRPLTGQDAVLTYPGWPKSTGSDSDQLTSFGSKGDQQTKPIEGLNLHSSVRVILNNQAIEAKSISFTFPEVDGEKSSIEVSLQELIGTKRIVLPVGQCKITLSGRTRHVVNRKFASLQEELFLGVVAKWTGSNIRKDGTYEVGLWVAAPSLPNVGSYEPWKAMLKRADAMDGPTSSRFLGTEMPKVLNRYQEWIKKSILVKINGSLVPITRFSGTGDSPSAWFHVLFPGQHLPERAPEWFFDVVVLISDTAPKNITSLELTIKEETLEVQRVE